MYAVIFRATIAELDGEYHRLAEHMKKRAFEKYGCLDFVSVTQDDQEVAISYWETREQIHAWKNDPEHRIAQQKGSTRWYQSYKIEVCEIIRK